MPYLHCENECGHANWTALIDAGGYGIARVVTCANCRHDIRHLDFGRVFPGTEENRAVLDRIAAIHQHGTVEVPLRRADPA